MAKRTFGSVRQRGSGRWQARYKGPDGTYHNAPMTYPTKRDAEAFLLVMETDIIRQTWRAPATSTAQLAEYGRRVIMQRQLRPQSELAYLADWRNHINSTIGTKPVGTITPADVRDWHANLTDSIAERMSRIEWTSTGRRDGAAAVARCYRILRMVLNVAVEDGLLEANPCKLKGAGTYKRPTRPTLSPEEVESLANLVPSRYRILTYVLAWVGPRLGEATELRARDYNAVKRQFSIDRAVYPINGEYVVGAPKSDAGKRIVSIPAWLAAEIDAMLEGVEDPDALLFTTRSGRCAYGAAQTAITRALREMGRPDVRVHDLRHTGHQLAAQSGATLADLMERLGHSTVAASMTYAHSAGDHGRALAERMDERRAEVIQLDDRRPA